MLVQHNKAGDLSVALTATFTLTTFFNLSVLDLRCCVTQSFEGKRFLLSLEKMEIGGGKEKKQYCLNFWILKSEPEEDKTNGQRTQEKMLNLTNH